MRRRSARGTTCGRERPHRRAGGGQEVPGASAEVEGDGENALRRAGGGRHPRELAGVDPERLGSVGHSLGAKEALYLAAFDERIKATVSSEGGIGTKFSNWDAPWYLGPAINEPAFTHEHHELLALAAPRPFLLVGGESADGDRGWPFIAAAKPVYELYGQPARLGQFNHRKGHAVPPEAEQRIEEWLLTYL